MKTITFIIAALLSFEASFLFAGNDEKTTFNHPNYSMTVIKSLAPTTPAEADFSEEMAVPVVTLNMLAPATPVVADFNDNVPETSISLSPVTPAEAGFNEGELSQPVNTIELKPTTPTNADFE